MQLEYKIHKCSNCQILTIGCICMYSQKYNFYKETKEYSGKYIKYYIYNICCLWKKRY